MLIPQNSERGTAMEIRAVRRPGEMGTQDLVRKYGERLVRNRCRYGSVSGRRFRMVELTVAERSEGCRKFIPPSP